jgi:hypothetical protein
VGLIAGSSEVEVTSGGRLITRSPLGDERAWVPDGPVAEGRFISTLGDSRLMFHMEHGRAVSYRGAINAQTEKRAPFTERLSTLTLMAGLTLFAALGQLRRPGAAQPSRGAAEPDPGPGRHRSDHAGGSVAGVPSSCSASGPAAHRTYRRSCTTSPARSW